MGARPPAAGPSRWPTPTPTCSPSPPTSPAPTRRTASPPSSLALAPIPPGAGRARLKGRRPLPRLAPTAARGANRGASTDGAVAACRSPATTVEPTGRRNASGASGDCAVRVLGAVLVVAVTHPGRRRLRHQPDGGCSATRPSRSTPRAPSRWTGCASCRSTGGSCPRTPPAPPSRPCRRTASRRPSEKAAVAGRGPRRATRQAVAGMPPVRGDAQAAASPSSRRAVEAYLGALAQLQAPAPRPSRRHARWPADRWTPTRRPSASRSTPPRIGRRARRRPPRPRRPTPTSTARTVTVAIIVAGLLVAVVLALLVARSVTGPVQRIREVLAQVAGGDLRSAPGRPAAASSARSRSRWTTPSTRSARCWSWSATPPPGSPTPRTS